MEEDALLTITLRLHAASGFVALVVAPLAMAVRKGGDWHRRWGRAFFWSMLVVALTAVLAGVLRPNVLMALVAVFSFHMVASGYRALFLKRLHQGQRPGGMDLLLHGTAGMVNAGLFIWGASHLFLGQRTGTAIIFTTFGAIGLLMVWGQVRRFFIAKHDKRDWFYAHMTGMLGGYIATVSAFSAVNLAMIRPMWLQWLWPTAVGVPLLVLWVRWYKARFAAGERMHRITDIRIR